MVCEVWEMGSTHRLFHTRSKTFYRIYSWIIQTRHKVLCPICLCRRDHMGISIPIDRVFLRPLPAHYLRRKDNRLDHICLHISDRRICSIFSQKKTFLVNYSFHRICPIIKLVLRFSRTTGSTHRAYIHNSTLILPPYQRR